MLTRPAMTQDVFSYNIEQAVGLDGHNVVTVARRDFGLDLAGAMEWVEHHHEAIVTEFLETRDSLASSEMFEADTVRAYCDGLGVWVRANESWIFESHRYFGTRGLEAQQTRVVELLPRKAVMN